MGDKLSETIGNTNWCGDDLLVGADAIARALNWYREDGRPNRRRVYHLVEQRSLPIHKVVGIGICARKSALKAFFDDLDQNSQRQAR